MTTTEPLRAVIYARVSSESQVEGTSLGDQRRICGAVIEQRGWVKVDEYFDEGITGTKRDRPQWQRMLADIRARRVDAVVVARLDRFARNAGHAITETDALAELGVAFVSVKENIDLTTSHGRLMRTMLAGFAELERDTIVDRTVQGQRSKARQGRWPGGQPPLGWRLHGRGKTAEPVPDDREREILRRIYEWTVLEGLTTGQVADRLNHTGRHTRSGVRWSYEQIRNQIANPVLHTGDRWWGAPDGRTRGHHTRLGKDGLPKYGEPVLFHLPDPPLTADEFAALQRAVALRANGKTGQQRQTRLLSGRLYGECGKHYNGANLGVREVPVYRCSGRRHRGVGAERCSCPQVQAADLERRVWGEVVQLLGDPDRLLAMARQWLELSDTGPDGSEDLADQLGAQVARLERALDRAAEQVLLSDDPTPYRKAAERVEVELAEVRRRLVALDAVRVDAEGRGRRLTDLATLAGRASSRLATMGEEERREVLGLLDVKVQMGPVTRDGGANGRVEWLRVWGQIDPRLFGGADGVAGGSDIPGGGGGSPDPGGTPEEGGHPARILHAEPTGKPRTGVYAGQGLDGSAPATGLEPVTVRLTVGCSAN